MSTFDVERVRALAAVLLQTCEGHPHDAAIIALLDAATGIVRMLRPSLDNAQALDHLTTIINAIKKAEASNHH